MPSYEEVRYHFNHYDPFARHMGIELLEVGPEHGVAIMPLDERHRNGMGHAHGGAIFALGDMTFAPDSNNSLKLIIEIFRLNLDSFVPSNRNRGK